MKILNPSLPVFGVVMLLASLGGISASAAPPVSGPIDQTREAPASPVSGELGVSGDDLYQSAEKAMAAKNYTEAARLFSIIVEKHPFSGYYISSAYQLGLALFKSGSKEDGSRYLLNALILDPKSRFSRESSLVLGDYYYDNNRMDEALVHYAFLLEHYSGPSLNDHVYYRSGKLRYDAGDAQGAAKDLWHLVREYPQSPLFSEGVVLLMESYNRTGNAYESARLFDEYRSRIMTWKDGGKTLLVAADAYLSLGLFERVMEMLADFDRLHSKSPHRPWALTLKGRAFFGQGALEKAEGVLKQAVSADRTSVEAALTISALYLKKGRAGDAASVLEPLSRSSDNRVKVRVLLQQGTALAAGKRFGDALGAFDAAVLAGEKMDPAVSPLKEALPMIHLGRGDALHELKRYKEAVEAYGKAKESGAQAGDLTWLHYRLGHSLELSGNDAKAVESYQQVLSSTADSFWTARANSRLDAIAFRERLKEQEGRPTQ